MSGILCCPADRALLAVDSEGVSCPACGSVFPSLEGAIHFQPPTETDRWPADPFEALAKALEGKSGEARESALAAFCSSQRYRRTLHGGDWKLLLPVDGSSTVLEIGAGLGEVTSELASRARHLVALLPNARAAALVRSQTVGSPNVSVGCLARLDRLPLADGSVDSIALSEDGLLGFALGSAGLPAFAAELRRVARPGATLLIGQSNALYRLPVLAALRARAKAGAVRSLEAALQRASIPRGTARIGRSAMVSAMRQAGFGTPKLFAPIPDEESAVAILPVADRTVVRYFLGHLVRRNALPTRAALALLRPIVAAGQFWRVVPYWYLVFEA